MIGLNFCMPQIMRMESGGRGDFFVQEKEISIFQVCYSIDDQKTLEREKRALIDAMKELNLQTGTILTYNQEDTIIVECGKICILPVWKWLIQNTSE